MPKVNKNKNFNIINYMYILPYLICLVSYIFIIIMQLNIIKITPKKNDNNDIFNNDNNDIFNNDNNDIFNNVDKKISKYIYDWFFYLGWGIVIIFGIGIFINIYLISNKKCVSNIINIIGIILITLYAIPTKIILNDVQKTNKNNIKIKNIIKDSQKWWYVIVISFVVGTIGFFLCNSLKNKNEI